MKADIANGNNYQVGMKDTRPWGHYEVVDVGARHVVKRITVNPGAKLSLQVHSGRNEHWVVVQGHARVTVGSEENDLNENGAVYIPAETQHRIENIGVEPLVVIETQYGRLLDENDIIRLEDMYNRLNDD